MAKKKKEETEEEEGGLDLDDAFADDDDVDYAPAETKKKKKKVVKKSSFDDIDSDENIKMKGKKSILEIKKGDKVNVDGVELEVDAHYVLMDHGKSKEMVIEMFDSESDKDYQLRYFDNRIQESAEFFELDEIVYNRKNVKKIEW